MSGLEIELQFLIFKIEVIGIGFIVVYGVFLHEDVVLINTLKYKCLKISQWTCLFKNKIINENWPSSCDEKRTVMLVVMSIYRK